MYIDGYIMLHRSILNWEWYGDVNTKTLFIHLLLTVNHKDQKWQGIVIKRGQRVCSIEKLSQEIRLTIRQTRTALQHLKSTNEVTCHSTPKYTLITVNNYDKYQSMTNRTTNKRQTTDTQNDKQSDNQATNCRQTTDNNIINTINTRNINNKNNINITSEMSGAGQAPAPDRKMVITLTTNSNEEYPIFQDQVDEWSELYPAVDVLQELRKMKGWIKANPNKRKTSRGMLRFINTWLSKEQDRGGNKGYYGKPVSQSSTENSEDSNSFNAGGIVL